MADAVEKAKEQLVSFWQGMDKGKKIRLGISSLLIIISLTGLIYFTTKTNFEIVYSDLSLSDMSKMQNILDESGIEWEVGDDGESLLVPTEMKNQAKIVWADAGYPKEGYSVLDAINDTSWTMSEYEKKELIKEANRNDLKNTITQMEGIRGAEVMLDIPEESPFSSDNMEASASVFLVLAEGNSLSQAKASTIKNLVAGAFTNLSAQNVIITDQYGNSYNNEGNLTEGYNVTDQLEIQTGFQTRLQNTIKNFLESIYGRGNVKVLANAKFNFDSEVTNIKQFSPPIEGMEEGLMRSIEKAEEHTVNDTGGGIAGVDSNSDDTTDYVTEDGSSSRHDMAQELINYELNEINKQIKTEPGSLESVSVSVLINLEAISDGELTDEKRKVIQELISTATGMDINMVTVSAERFAKPDIPEIDLNTGNNVNGIGNIPYWAIGLVALSMIGIFGITMVNRNKKSKEDNINELLEEKSRDMEEIDEIDFDSEKSEFKKQVSTFVEKKPETVAVLLRSWLNED